MKKTIWCMFVLVLLLVSVQAAAAEADWSPDIEFTTVDTEGVEWSDRLFADAPLTMLNLWAYWCPPCVGEMPDLQRLSDDYEGLQIIGVSPKEYEEENVRTMQELGITYPTLRLTQSLDSVMNTGYIPTTVFVDSAGHILGDVYVGGKSYDAWAAIIEEYLGEVQDVSEAAPADGASEEEWDMSVPTEITDEIQALFDAAMEKLAGVDYTPVAVLGAKDDTWCLLCKATVVYPGAKPYNALVYINEDGVQNIYELWIEKHSTGTQEAGTQDADGTTNCA